MGENINWKDVTSVTIDGNKAFSIYSPEALIMDTDKEMEKKKGDNMEKIDNILERYKKYQLKEIDRQCDEDIKFIRDTSDLAKIYDKLKTQAKKELIKLYPDKDYEEIENYIYISYENDNKCQKDINERVEYRDEKIGKIKQKIEDAKALIEIAETFEQKMEILKNYNIIDKEGRINIYE